MDWEIVGWKISFCSEDCICNEFLGLYYEWMACLPKVADELLCRTSQASWSPSETLGWSNRIFCAKKNPLIMVSGGQLWNMEFSWKNFCTVVLETLMFGCNSFPCPSRTVALTRTGISFVRCLKRAEIRYLLSSHVCLASSPPINIEQIDSKQEFGEPSALCSMLKNDRK